MKFKKITLFTILILAIVSFSFKDRFFEIAKQIEIYNNVYKTVNINYIDEVNPGDITVKAINNTLKDLDPYTRFYNEQQVEDVKISRAGEYAGMGVSSYYSNEGIVIKDILKDYPGDKSGLKAGDLITDVNGQNLKGMERDQLSQVLKGTPGTKLKLTVNRAGKKLKINLTLDQIQVNPVPFYDMIDAETGYIKLTRFTNTKATTQVRDAFIKLEEKGMKKLVFDLRHNPGGSLFDAINITNLFIEKDKKVVETKGKLKSNSRVYKTKNLPLNLEVPIVVLIDGRSASASEIVSGSLQDYDRAVVMGERSFGKGLVQRYFDLNYGTKMKVTISKYYTPSGRCIQELDYSNRDPKTGKVPKFSEGKVTKFKTEKGRPVYDGGGVMPDIEIGLSKLSEETEDLLKSNTLFNFSTEYVRKNPIADLNSFKFTDADFNSFKSYLIESDTAFVTKQEKLFKDAYTSVKQTKNVANSYELLMKKLNQDKVDLISVNKDRVSDQIVQEILFQYFYEKGKYEYNLKNDQTIKRAVTLLKDEKKYNKILK